MLILKEKYQFVINLRQSPNELLGSMILQCYTPNLKAFSRKVVLSILSIVGYS